MPRSANIGPGTSSHGEYSTPNVGSVEAYCGFGGVSILFGVWLIGLATNLSGVILLRSFREPNFLKGLAFRILNGKGVDVK